MRITILAALVSLIVGGLAAFGYDHYFGEGKQLADSQERLDSSTVTLATITKQGQDARKEIDALTAQVQQLTTDRDDLQHQVDQLKSTAASPAPAPSNSMTNIMKGAMAQQQQQRLLLLESRLHLTPDQITAVTAALDEESKRGEEAAAKMMAGGKVDMTDFKNFKSVDQTLNDILTPEQKTEYQQMQTDQKNSAAETMATMELNQISPLLQLSDSQKDQVYSALYQAQTDTQDPAWIKKNMNTSDPATFLEAQAKAKSDALSKILTPDQMTVYQQQAQSQLNMQKAMMQKFAPALNGAASAAPIVAVPANP